jgi:hypothetical protein
MFLAGLSGICDKYVYNGSPPLWFAAENSGLNAGCVMGYRSVMLECLKLLEYLGGSGDPQVRWRRLAEAPTAPQVIYLDQYRSVFQCLSDHPQLTLDKGRLKGDKRHPCILHANGGYCDPKIGRDAQLKPYWDMVYPGVTCQF